MQNFNEKISMLMNAKGLTQQSLANGLNISQSAVGKWQRGESVPNPRTMMKLATFFNISYESLRDNTKTITLEETINPISNFNPDVVKLKEDLSKIITLRDNLNNTISEVVVLLERQISNIKKF